MRNRMYPLGYRVENGEIVIDDDEAEIVKGIFNDYCNGKSLKALVYILNERNAVFKENGGQWNKGRIYHILMDRRYIGEKSYPPIIEADVFDKANGLKNSKRVFKRPISEESEYLKGKVFCGKCGSRYIRIIDTDKKERWVCANGCRLGRRPTDEKLLAAIQVIMKRVEQSPELLLQPIHDAGYKRTLEIMRLTNEISRMNEQVAPSFNTGKKLLFQLAANKFSACKEDKSVYTDYVSEQIKKAVERGGAYIEFMQNAVHKVLVTGKNEYAIVFVNGAIVSNKEVSGDASESCNKDRSEPAVI